MMLFLACDYRSKCRFRIVLSQRIQSFEPLLSFSFQTDSFSPFNLPSASLEHGQQFFKVFRLACQYSIKCFPQSIPLRGFRFITQPFIIALAMSLRLLDNRQTVLDAQCITEPPDGFWTAPEIAKLPITIKIHRRNNNMWMERILSRNILSGNPPASSILWIISAISFLFAFSFYFLLIYFNIII